MKSVIADNQFEETLNEEKNRHDKFVNERLKNYLIER